MIKERMQVLEQDDITDTEYYLLNDFYTRFCVPGSSQKSNGGPIHTLHVIRGIGGTEVVFKRCVDFIAVNDFSLPNFEIEVGGMDYGFKINGILGMDFLISSGAIINLKDMYLQFDE